jgi:AraC-like DNA-binding protein
LSTKEDRLKFWRPWSLKQLELLQGTNVSNPCCQQFAQSYVIGTIQSGKGILHYRSMNMFHLAHLFRHVIGLPPHAYQIQLRLSHARDLLGQGFPVGYVAHETGFFDQTHFTYHFKRHVGVTPGTYRKTARSY